MRILILILSVCIQISVAQELTIIAVGDAEIEAEKILVHSIAQAPNLIAKAQEINDIIRNDFSFYKKTFAPFNGATEQYTHSGQTDWEWLKTKNMRYLVLLSISAKEKQLSLQLDVSDVGKQELIFSTTSVLSGNIREFAHKLSDLTYQAITGKESIFNSKIVFVSDLASTKTQKIKELYIMDFDGGNKTRLTKHRGIVISPEISHDRKSIVYSLIREGTGVRNVNLYLLDMATKTSKLISSKQGINSGAIFSQDDSKIYLTLSAGGDSDIYEMDLATKATRPITKHPAIDVDPSLSKDGTIMTFLSGRPGKAMIYTIDPAGIEKDVKRISFVGQYNATPRFDPEGKQIVFASWLDNCFDLFRINSDGSGLVRLTKEFGSNEDPTYSNDGQFIAFSSQRVLSMTSATQKVYIMDKDGEILGSITEGFGNCITPRWSK